LTEPGDRHAGVAAVNWVPAQPATRWGTASKESGMMSRVKRRRLSRPLPPEGDDLAVELLQRLDLHAR
jgi:hypothetical protein